MPETLLQTKLFKPALRPQTVPRTRLLEKLDKGLPGKVSLVSAPAGFGKTTLVAAWLEKLKRPFSWLSLDEEDNDPVRFFTYITAALQSLSNTVEFTPPSANLPLKAMTTLLVNNLLQLSTPAVLVLDDYHLIKTEAIHEALTFLCDHLPPTLHLVLITRSDPPLPLARMRVRGELNEVRQKDVRFTVAETAVFLNDIMGLNLTPNNIAALEARTEGWIASLQLAGLSLQDANDASEAINAFSGTHRYIVDYLVEEVLAQRPPQTREFLLKTSVLERFCGPLCDAILGSGDWGLGTRKSQISDLQSQFIINQLDNANYFLIPLDNERNWYRYHHLFADVLRQRAKQQFSEQLPRLYQEAAHWFAAHGYLYDAIDMALAGADFEHASRLILRAAETEIWERGEWLLLDRWLDGLPESLVKSHPRLCLNQSWGYLVQGQLAEGLARLQDAEKAILINPDANLLAQGEMAAIRAAVARFQGNQPQVIAQADIALTHLPSSNLTWRVMTLLNLGAAHFLGDDETTTSDVLTEAWQLAKANNQAMLSCVSGGFLAQLWVRYGRYHQAQQQYEKAQSIALQQPGSVFNIGMTHLGLGELHLAWNDLEKADALLQEGLEIGLTVQNLLLILSGSLALARLRQIQGDLDEANALILQAQEVANNPTATWSFLHVPTSAHLAQAWLRQGDLDAARRLMETAVTDAQTQPGFWVESQKIIEARVRMAEKQWREAEGLLSEVWETAVSHQRIQNQIEIRILQAIIQHNLQQFENAQSYLKEALILAQPTGEIRRFLDEGEAIQTLINTMHFDDEAMQTYVNKIASAFPHKQTHQKQNANQQLVEPLTNRELELLALVANGTSNRDIAAQLFISYATVRRHLNNIYGKLGVNGRSQAILRAQELNLV